MWVYWALAAAILWGLNYVLAERLLKSISVYTLMAIELTFGLVVVLLIGLVRGHLNEDLTTIANNRGLWLFLALTVVAYTAANLAIFFSVAQKNAAIAGLIEISYPLFIVLFSWLLLGDSHVSKGVALGGILIFAGVGIIYFTA